MKTSTIIKFTAWIIVSIALVNLGLNMLTASNTIKNVIGLFVVLATIVISIKTRCLTNVTIKKK